MMNEKSIAALEKWMRTGNEIEFSYLGKRFSITYGKKDNGKDYISFCEFYRPDTEYDSIEEFLTNARIGSGLLSDIWKNVEDVEVF